MKHTHLRSLLLLTALGVFSFASAQMQMQPNPAKNWQNENLEKDSVYGTGSDSALALLKGKKSTRYVFEF